VVSCAALQARGDGKRWRGTVSFHHAVKPIFDEPRIVRTTDIIHGYVNGLRLRRAFMLLATRCGIRVSEVALEVGFSDILTSIGYSVPASAAHLATCVCMPPGPYENDPPIPKSADIIHADHDRPRE
jgi:hypothetical protein